MKILVINGPNINMLGIREPGIYGSDSFETLCNNVKAHAKKAGIEVKLFQSNHEGALVDEIQAASEETYENIDLKRAIENLDPKDRAIVVLRFFEDRQLEEIAKILDENLSTVKSRLYRVMKKLRLNLEGSTG